MPVTDLPIFTYYDRQRFVSFGSSDCANWYGVQAPTGKKGQAMYPAMGRAHINFLGQNRLVFDAEPREVFRSIDFVYIIVGTRVFQMDKFYNLRQLPLPVSLAGDLWFDYLPVQNVVYCGLTDGTNVFIITEDGANAPTMVAATTNAPENPAYIAVFGNRFVVSSLNTPRFQLTQVNLGDTQTDPATWFSIPSGEASFPLFASATGIIRQIAVLHNQMYIFTDFTTDPWSNIPTQITVENATVEFPFKLSSSYNWDYGIQDPHSIDTDFGMMVWLSKNKNGLVTFMMSDGQYPQPISTQAINVLLEKSSDPSKLNPFLEAETEGFLYQWENTVFYRASAGEFFNFGAVDDMRDANCIEYNFQTKTWGRAIELNGERNRIRKHVFFNNQHLVTVKDDSSMYVMAGDLYYNELRNPGTDAQATNAFAKFPMRYELVTQQIFEEDYSEFLTDYVEIDFVFGNQTFYKSQAPFDNAVYLVDETSTSDVPVYLVTENNEFIIAEGSNTPQFDDNHYYALFKPHIELYYSDDGGVTFTSADLREFSPLGMYRWRMRWYELGASRNRCYKLVCVSSAPIVILGAVQNKRRISGGAN